MFQFALGSKSRSEIYAFMCKHGKGLRSDKDFKKEIKVHHRDGSKFHLYSCQIGEDETRIFIWTEHCGYLYFYKEDIEEMEIWEWEWKGFPESENEEENWQIIEHKIINFDMEVKPSGEQSSEAKESVSN